MAFNPNSDNPFASGAAQADGPTSGRAGSPEPSGGGQFSPINILENVFYFRWYFIVIFAVVSVFAVINALLATPIYMADSLVQIQERKGSSLGGVSQLSNGMLVENQNSSLISEIEILRSRTVIGQAVQDLKANTQISVTNRLPLVGNWLSRILSKDADGLTKPLWGGSNRAWGGEKLEIDRFTVPPHLLGHPFTLSVGTERSWELLDEDGNALIKAQGVGQEMEGLDGKLKLRLSSLKARPGTEFKITTYSTLSGIGQLLGSLGAAPAQKGSNLLKLTYEDSNPERAAMVLNTIANAYVQQNVNARSEEAKRSLEFLKQELPKLKAELEASENALNEYRNENKSLDLNAEVGQVLGISSGLEKQRMELELKRRQMSLMYEPDHPLLKGLNSQLAGLNAQSARIDHQINELPQVQQDYIRKTRDVEVNGKLYVSLLNNSQQLELAKAGTVGSVAVIDPAVVPQSSVRPNKPKIVSAGALLGLVLGFLACQLLALITGVVRDPKTLEKALGLPTLAILPISPEQVQILERQIEGEREGDSEEVYLLALEKPSSPVVEAIRSLRTSVLFALSEKPRSKVVLITSAVPSQGKSFISANLSYLLGASGKRALLIEADVRRASLKRYIHFDTKAPGLSSILLESVAPELVILKDVYPNTDFLPAGPRVKNPGDMLSNDNVSHLINGLAEQYDYVVIDSPPLLPVNDARALSLAADITLFVARQDMVSLSEIREALEIFTKSGNLIDGMIFNGYVPSRIRYGYNYSANYWRYGGGYGKYGAYRSYRSEGAYGQYGSYDKYGRYVPKIDRRPKNNEPDSNN